MALPCSRLHGSSIVRHAIIRKLSSTSSKQIFLLRFPRLSRQQVIPRPESTTIQPGVVTGCHHRYEERWACTSLCAATR
jgi:hypothetical protein